MSANLSRKTIETLGLESDRFRTFGTKRVALEGSDFHRYKHDTQITGIGEDFRAHDSPIFLSGDIRARESSHGRFQLAFQTANQRVFDTLLSGLDALPDLNPHKRLQGNYLIVDIASSAILRSEAMKVAAVSKLREAITEPGRERLYYFTPLEITGYDDTMMLPKKERTSYEWQDAS